VLSVAAIICLGNRFAPGDGLGCQVFDQLSIGALPPGVEVIDGGLCGLDLLHVVEGKQRVVFADAVAGVADPEQIVVMDQTAVAAFAKRYGHGAGLPYLLHLLPHVCTAPLPHITLVGACGDADMRTVRAVAKRCVEIAIHGTT
jgi:hydrogenase maturation protease